MSKLEDVAALLREEMVEEQHDERRPEEEAVEHEASGDPTDSPSGDPTDSPSDDPTDSLPPERQTVKSLAQKLGVKPSEVYNLLEVSLPNDKVYTLGEIKDLAAQGVVLGKTKDTLEKDATDLLVQRRELQLVAEQMATTGRISQAEVDAMRQAEEKRLAAEMQNFQRSVPSWSDPVVRSREIDAISKHAKSYGISIPKFEALVTDARVMKLIRDAALAVPEQKPAVQPRRAPLKAAKPVGKLDQISALLAGGT